MSWQNHGKTYIVSGEDVPLNQSIEHLRTMSKRLVGTGFSNPRNNQRINVLSTAARKTTSRSSLIGSIGAHLPGFPEVSRDVVELYGFRISKMSIDVKPHLHRVKPQMCQDV